LVAARESLDIAERIDSAQAQGLALHSFGRSLALAGDAAAAVSALERAQPLLARTMLFWEPEASSDLALAHCSLGALTEAEATAERALERAVRCSALRGEVLALHALAAVRLARGGDAAALAEAQRLLDRADSRAAEIGYRLILPRLHERRADLARQRGDAAAAGAALREAHRLYTEMGATNRAQRVAAEIAV
jgi:tetratricopeptide (TPR) repeat protein